MSNVATNLEKYHASGINHKISGDGLCDALSDASRAFRGDETIEEPLNKVSDYAIVLYFGSLGFKISRGASMKSIGFQVLLSLLGNLLQTQTCHKKVNVQVFVNLSDRFSLQSSKQE